MNDKILEAARQAGFDVIGSGVFPPTEDDSISYFLIKFAEIIQQQGPVNAELLAALKYARKYVPYQAFTAEARTKPVDECRVIDIVERAIANAERP